LNGGSASPSGTCWPSWRGSRAKPMQGDPTDTDSVNLSIVLPIFNEEAAIETVLASIQRTVDELGVRYEIVCVDDGSADRTVSLLNACAGRDPRIRVLVLSRNFGKESAIAAGLSEARGEAVVLMDADLQHPPELIREMVQKWHEGFEVVNAVKSSRGDESFAHKQMAHVFNFLMGSAASSSFQGASDFKLLDRQVVDALLQLPERARFFRGLVAWIGFRTAEVEFDVKDRVAGETKWSLTQLVRYSLRNLLSYSSFPLKAVAVIGAGTLVLTGLLAVWTLYRYIRGDALTGFTTVILLQLILGSLLLVGVGVTGLYISELFNEVKRRPVFVLRSSPKPRPRVAPKASQIVQAPRPGEQPK
jgi:polyisoprenyl-phosphate glycosyltransferase